MENRGIKELMSLSDNSLCADCLGTNPQWASTTFGAFICLKCSGIHRGLGTHITLVRSCTLDSWSPSLLNVMGSCGNKKVNEFFEAYLPEGFRRPNHNDPMAMKRFIEQKYVEKKFSDRGTTAPHLLVQRKLMSSSKSEPLKERVVSKPIPQPKQAKTMIRSESTEIDAAVGNIVGGRPKIRVRHSRHAKEVSVPKMNHSSSMQIDNIKVTPKDAIISDDDDDFFKDVEETKVVPNKNKQEKNVPQETVEEKKEAINPLSLAMDLDLGSNEIDDADFFDDDGKSEENQEIKVLPPLAAIETKPVMRPALKKVEDSQNPFVGSSTQRTDSDKESVDHAPINDLSNQIISDTKSKNEENSAPKLRLISQDDDCLNPFLENKEEETKESKTEKIFTPDIDDSNSSELEDFFGDKPRQKPDIDPTPPKPKMESCCFVPPVQDYHPRNPDPPEFVQKISDGFEVAKEKASEAFDFIKGKISSMFNKDNIPNSEPVVHQPTPVQIPNKNVQIGVRPQLVEDEDVDEFFGDSIKKAPNIPSKNIIPVNGKQYKIKKRGSPQTSSLPAPEKITNKRIQSKDVDGEGKPISIDDAVEFIVSDNSSQNQRKRHRTRK